MDDIKNTMQKKKDHNLTTIKKSYKSRVLNRSTLDHEISESVTLLGLVIISQLKRLKPNDTHPRN